MLQQTKMTIVDINMIELNEAFTTQAISGMDMVMGVEDSMKVACR